MDQSQGYISNYNFISKDAQIREMLPLQGIVANSKVKKCFSCIESGLSRIKHIKEIAQVELAEKTAATDFTYWRQVLTNEIEVCQQAIKWIKLQDKPDNPTLIKIKALKLELQMLDDKAAGQADLMQNRETLYGSRELKAISGFDQILNKIIEEDGQLQEGCQHLKNVLQRHMHIASAPITYVDVHKLKAFYKQIEGGADKRAEVTALVKHEIDLLEKSFENKKSLLKELCTTLPALRAGKPFDQWPTQQKLAFYVKSQQILHNPFEPPLDFLDYQLHSQREDANDPQVAAFNSLCRIVEKESEPAAAAPKKDFWDFVHVFEKKAHQLALTKELKTQLYDLKIEGLKHILSKVEKKASKEVLVIGGGPAGLLRAVALGFTGHTYRVLEKRPNETLKRSNVITLGSGNFGNAHSKDLLILLFLGFISAVDLDERGSFGHLKPNLLEIPLGDVEKYFMQILTEIGHSQNIAFQSKPLRITNNGHAQAEVAIENSAGAIEIMQPSLIMAVDGASSPTRTMLGISKQVLAKTTQIAYSTFEVDPPKSIFQSLKYRIYNFLRGAALAVASAIYALVFKVPLETAYNHVVEGGPTAIFRIPEHVHVPGMDKPMPKGLSAKSSETPKVMAHDYLIRVLREKEQAFIDTYKDRVEAAAFKIRRANQKLGGDLSTEKRLQLVNKLGELTKEHAESSQQLENVLTSQAQHMHGLLDVLCSMISKKHKIQPMQVNKNFLVDVVVGTAEQSLVKVGKTPIVLRGDASHTTDPHCGYGCKTAIEETLADQFMLSFGQLDEMSETELSCHNWAHQFYQDTMINQGLRDRSHYRQGTELLSRYLDRGVKDGLLTGAEARIFHTIAGKAHLAQTQGSDSLIRFSSVEKDFMKQQAAFLRVSLKAQWESIGATLKKLDTAWVEPLTSREAKILEKAIKTLNEIPQIAHAKVSTEMQPIVAKLAYENSRLAPTLGLLMCMGNCLRVNGRQG